MHLHDRLGAVQDLAAQLGESDVAPAGDDVIRQLDDFLLACLVRDFRAAQDDGQMWRHPLEHGHQAGGLFHVPDIDAEADDARRMRQDALDQVGGLGADDEFLDPGLLLQRAHIGQQVAQAERGVRIAGVEGREQDRHGGSRRAAAGKAVFYCDYKHLPLYRSVCPVCFCGVMANNAGIRQD